MSNSINNTVLLIDLKEVTQLTGIPEETIGILKQQYNFPCDDKSGMFEQKKVKEWKNHIDHCFRSTISKHMRASYESIRLQIELDQAGFPFTDTDLNIQDEGEREMQLALEREWSLNNENFNEYGWLRSEESFIIWQDYLSNHIVKPEF